MVNRPSAPLVVLGVAVAAAAAAIQVWAPASLLPAPARPFERPPADVLDARAVLERPARLVSQSWSSDEFLYTVVPPARVVGVSEGAYERRFSNVYQLAERYRPVIALDPERVLRLDPDLVLAPVDARFELSGLLRASGVAVHRVDTMFPTLASLEEHIRLTGRLTGEEARADEALRRFRGIVARAAARKPAGAPALRVMGFGGVYTYGSDTLFHDILRVLGAENVAATHGFAGYDRVTDEHIVRWNPDWIVAGADRGRVDDVRARLLAHPAIGQTTAAARGRIVVLEHHVFLPLSPFTAQLVEAIAAALYGGAA